MMLEKAIFDDLIAQVAETARLIHSYGWAEANAGNLSIDVTDLLPDFCPPQGRCFLVSRTGSRYRQTAQNPRDNLLFISTLREQDSFYPSHAKPTSEWISHRCLQLALPQYKVILHTHPAEIIALASDPISDDPARLNDTFTRILPELPLYLPQGIAICPHYPPGSRELCDASLNALTDQKALIWSGHGLLTFAGSLDEALDYQEIVSKAARVYFLGS